MTKKTRSRNFFAAGGHWGSLPVPPDPHPHLRRRLCPAFTPQQAPPAGVPIQDEIIIVQTDTETVTVRPSTSDCVSSFFFKLNGRYGNKNELIKIPPFPIPLIGIIAAKANSVMSHGIRISWHALMRHENEKGRSVKVAPIMGHYSIMIFLFGIFARSTKACYKEL